MSQTAAELLILYETEAEQWATYLRSVFTGPISEAGICTYDIAALSNQQENLRWLARYTCKLLILSKGMLEGLCQMRRFFLGRLLSPATRVVVLLCGVESLTPLLELLPLNGNECVQISCEQEADEYLSTVTNIVRKGVPIENMNPLPLVRKPSGSEENMEQMQSAEACIVTSSSVVVPSRVPCGSSMEVFILLKNEVAGSDTEVEFIGENQMLRVKPIRWNERILCTSAPAFPAGDVKVTVYSDGQLLSETQLQYYSNIEEIASLLARAADPVDFMCQALQESSVETLDEKLSSMLLEGMPTGGFQGLQCEDTPEGELHHADVPSLLHFAAQYGFKSVSSLLLQCPGAERALHTANRHGQTPAEIAKSHGHAELHVLLNETLNTFDSGEDNGDASVYEMMCAAGTASNADAPTQQEAEDEEEEEEDEDIYTPLGVTDEYDIRDSANAVAIANRPPAPTPRPASTQVKVDRTPYITKVFQKKTAPQGDSDLYSLPTKLERGREDRTLSAYDTFVPKQPELQQRAKAGSVAADGALGDWQRAQKGPDAVQQEKPTHLSVSATIREQDEGTYDKINIIHHTPSVAGNGSRRESQATESDFYSKPLKGQHSNFISKADKR